MNMKIVTHAKVAVLAAATGLFSGCGREEVSATSSADQPKEAITAIEKMSPSLAERIKTLAEIRNAANIASCNAWLGGDVADTRATSSFNDQLPEHVTKSMIAIQPANLLSRLQKVGISNAEDNASLFAAAKNADLECFLNRNATTDQAVKAYAASSALISAVEAAIGREVLK